MDFQMRLSGLVLKRLSYVTKKEVKVCKVMSGLLLEPLNEEFQELQILNHDVLKVHTNPISIYEFLKIACFGFLWN